MPRKKVSLGGAIWGAPAAEGFEVPSENAPDAWLLALAEEHGEADNFQAVFRTCRGGKQWCLRNAPYAKVKLLVLSQQSSAAFQKQLAGVKGDVAMRKPKRTGLSIEYEQQPNAKDRTPPSDPLPGNQALLSIPGALNTAGHLISELRVVFKGNAEYNLAKEFMESAAQVFKKITSLVAPTCILPHPDEFAKVTKLSIPCPAGPQEAAINQSIGRFVGKVTEFSYTRGIPRSYHFPHPVWSQVFTAPSDTLTHFTTAYALTDDLARLLSQHTPNLAELHVSGVALKPESMSSDLAWSVQRLFVDQGNASAYVPHLANLPTRPDNGQLELIARGSWRLDVDRTNGPDPAILPRLPQFLFKVQEAVPVATHYTDCGKVAFSVMGDNQGALANHLQLLGPIQTTANMMVVELLHCPRDHPTAQAARNTMQGLAHRFVFGMKLSYLTNEHVPYMMTIGNMIRGVSVDRVYTRAVPYPAGSVWSSGKINVTGQLMIAPLLYLPPTADGAPVVVGASELRLCDQDASRIDFQRLPNLDEIRFAPLTAGGNFQVHIGGSAKHTRSKCPLQTQTTLLQKIHTQAPPMRIVFSGFINEPAVEALQGLPERDRAILDLSEAKWDLKSVKARQFVMTIPTSYREWVLKIKVPSEYSVAIFEGINDKRRGLRLPKLKVRIVGKHKVAEGAEIPKRIKIVQ